jgi:uncharacterized protein YlxW (UPF0749 family)
MNEEIEEGVEVAWGMPRLAGLSQLIRELQTQIQTLENEVETLKSKVAALEPTAASVVEVLKPPIRRPTKS